VAALTAFTPLTTGVVNAGAAVAASDTIDAATLGSNGVFLEIINGNASPDTVTIKDFGTTAAGNALTTNQYTKSVVNATSQIFIIKPSQVDPTTGLVTITHSVTATVTYKMYSLAGV
jgi:type IV secretory pathway VirB9-like protein